MSNNRLNLLRNLLNSEPKGAKVLATELKVSQPTLSRLLRSVGNELIRFGPYQSIHYALRRPLLSDVLSDGEIPIFRVTTEAKIEKIGDLIPVQPLGYVMRNMPGEGTFYDGLPWWLQDMWPQGFLGRAFVDRVAGQLGLPDKLGDWQEHHILRALLSQSGMDAVGNLLLGEQARSQFIHRTEPHALPLAELPQRYAELAQQATAGEVPGSSAGGEQPKFACYAETPNGVCHVLVKFSLPDDNPLTQRWRDLLLAEHHALSLLDENGLAAGNSRIVDHGNQRFLEVQRFDRIGPLGRRGLISLSALDGAFSGLGKGNWPAMTVVQAREGHISQAAHQTTCALHAFGTLIGNSDMHAGNLSFLAEGSRPYELAPAYDMLPMAFAPRASGEIRNTLAPVSLDASIPADIWQSMAGLAEQYLQQLDGDSAFSPEFAPCVQALTSRLQEAKSRIARMA